MTKPYFECPLDIFAYYLRYPPEFVAWCKSQGWHGFIDGNHAKVFYSAYPKRKATPSPQTPDPGERR